MLKVFRDNLKYLSWVLWGVILVFVLFAFTDFGSQSIGGTAPNTAAAVVGDHEISYEEFQNAYRQVETQYREAYGQQFSRELANQLGLPFQVLNQLVDQRLLLAEAERIGLEVTDQELQEAIIGFPVFQENGAFIGEEAYREFLNSRRMRVADFEASLRMDLATQKMREVLAGTVYVAASEVEQAYRETAETASIRLLRLPAARFASEVTVDEAALAAYFDDHRETYRLPERRVVDYLIVDSGALAGQVTITDEQVRADYDANRSDFEREEQVKARHILLRTGAERTVEAAREEIAAIRARIEAGEDFAALAADLSDDPGSRDKGGDLGFFGRGAMVPPFEEAAFGAELGELVGPVESGFGVHLIQVQARRPGGVQPLEEVEAGIRSRLVAERTEALAEQRARELADRLRGGARDAADLEALAAEQEAVSYAATAPFGREDNVAGIGRGTDFTVRAFEMEAGDVGEPVRISRGWAVPVLRSIEEPRLPELDEVRAAVTADVRANRQLEAARQRLEAAKLGADSLDELAAELETTVEEAGPFGLRGSVGPLGRAPEVARRALELEVGEMSPAIERDGEVVVFEVTERTRFDPVDFEGEKATVRQRLEDQRAAELLQSLLTQRRDELGVTYDPQVFEVFGQSTAGAS